MKPHGVTHAYGPGDAAHGNGHEHGMLGHGAAMSGEQIRAIFAKGGSSEAPTGPLRAPKNLPAAPPGHTPSSGAPKAPAGPQKMAAPKKSQLTAGGHLGSGGKSPQGPSMPKHTGELPKAKAPPLKPGQFKQPAPKTPKPKAEKAHKPGHDPAEKAVHKALGNLGKIGKAGSEKGSALKEAVKLGGEAIKASVGGEQMGNAVKPGRE